MAFYYGQTEYTESVSAVTATNSVSLGSRRWENGTEYVYAYNAGNSQISRGYGCIASANSGYSVTVSAALGDKCAGVCYHATMTTGTYGWLAVKGICHVYSADAIATLGNGLALDTNGVFCEVITTAGTASLGETGLVGLCGVALETITTGGTGCAMLYSCVF